MRKRAFRYSQDHPTFENLTQFKHLCAKAHRSVRKAERTSWEMYVSFPNNTLGGRMEQNMPRIW